MLLLMIVEAGEEGTKGELQDVEGEKA